MKARDILMQCRTALSEITAIEHQIDRLMTTGAPSGGGGGPRREKIKGTDEYVLVGGATNNPEAARAQAVDGCEAVLEQKKQKLADLLQQMENLLDMLADGGARTVLRYYYGVGWTDEKIAEELETSREVITRQRNAAVNYLESQKVTESHKAHVL